MLTQLDTRWAGRGEVVHEKQMDSTNRVAKDMARAGAVHGSLAVCDEQTAGRGRMDRRWETPAGEALTQSMVLRPKLLPEQAQLITLAAAVASAKAIEDVCPGLKAGIKWPNDGIVNGKKCVGVLCEMGLEGAGLAWVVPGVGINVNQTAFPEELKDKATSLRLECGHEVDRWAVLCAYLKRMEEAVDAVEKDGLSGILQDYLSRSVTIGQKVCVIAADETYTALANGIDETGALLVTDENGCERRVLCGDVSVRGLMGYVLKKEEAYEESGF